MHGDKVQTNGYLLGGCRVGKARRNNSTIDLHHISHAFWWILRAFASCFQVKNDPLEAGENVMPKAHMGLLGCLMF